MAPRWRPILPQGLEKVGTSKSHYCFCSDIHGNNDIIWKRGGYFNSYPPFVCFSSQGPQALLENPLFLGTVRPSRCIGPAGIKAVHPSRDTSSRPDPPVSHTRNVCWASCTSTSISDRCNLVVLPVDEGLWDILIKDIPKEVTSYTLNLEMLREGLTYDFRVIAVNDYGYGSPSAPSPSISGTPI